MFLSEQDQLKILEELEIKPFTGAKFKDVDDYVVLEHEDKEFNIFPNYEAAYEAAKESMQNLFDDIGIEGWNSDFVRNYYTIREGDIRFLVDDMVEAEREAIEEEIQDNMSQQGYEPDEETGDLGDEFNNEVEDRLEDMRRDYERKLSDDPKDFLVEELGYYSEEDFFKQSFVDYDVERLIEDSIDSDGLANTLAAYDGDEIQVGDYHIYRWN